MGKGDRRGKGKLPQVGAWRPPELAPIQSSRHKLARGHDGKFTGKQEDPRAHTLDLRARKYGKDIPEKDSAELRALRRRMSAPWLEHPLGMVMERKLGVTSEMAKLWTTWADLCAAYRTFAMRVLDHRPGPKGSNMPLLNDRPPDAKADEREDLRTDEEKARDARASYRAWRGRLSKLWARERQEIEDAIHGTGKPLWDVETKSPTSTGLRVLEALQELVEQIERER